MKSVVSLSTALALKSAGPDRETTIITSRRGDEPRAAIPSSSVRCARRRHARLPPIARRRRRGQVGRHQTREQDGEKGGMAGDEEALRRGERAEALRDAETTPPISVPHSDPRAADDGRLEGEDELRRAGIRVEGRAHRQKGAGDRRPSPSRWRRRWR